MIDLHLHTKCSDGQFSPTEIVRMAASAGITAMAITDHDTASGIAEAKEAALQYGITCFSGIEISVKGAGELHILGYGIDPDSKSLQEFCQKHAKNRQSRSLRLIQYLNSCGVFLTLEEVQAYNEGRSSGRPHFARALAEKGYASSVSDAFDRYLTTPEYYANVERPKPTPEKGIRIIQEAGGIAVLAHPHQVRLPDTELDSLVVSLRQQGLSGIEAYYSLHTSEQTAFYLRLAEKYDLLVTCGSDYHGPKVKPDIQMGTGVQGSLCVTDENIVQRLSQKIALHQNQNGR